ncbi:hypothetical protein D9M72_622800 [compost metagenome]
MAASSTSFTSQANKTDLRRAAGQSDRASCFAAPGHWHEARFNTSRELCKGSVIDGSDEDCALAISPAECFAWLWAVARDHAELAGADRVDPAVGAGVAGKRARLGQVL